MPAELTVVEGSRTIEEQAAADLEREYGYRPSTAAVSLHLYVERLCAKYLGEIEPNERRKLRVVKEGENAR